MARKKQETTEEKVDNNQAIELALGIIEKQFGKGSVLVGTNNKLPSVEFRTTGCMSLDKILGGGFVKGRIVEIYGPESCIYKDSFLQYEVWTADGKRQINHKGGSIGRLYERFHSTKVEGTPNQGCHLQANNDVEYYVKSVNDEGSIIRNKVLDVVKTGEKTCFQIATEAGNSIVATPEHKFLTPHGFKPLEELEIGDTVFIHNNTRRKGRKYYPNRPEVMVKYHPTWPTKVVHDKKTGNDYLYYRGQKSRAVYEAYMNSMSLEQYLNLLNNGSKNEIDSLFILPNNIHIHHKDENFLNNEIRNLQPIDPTEHGMLHAKDRHANLSFIMVPTKIVMKELVGPRDTYDLKCAFPYNNYIAEGIVVHNSGKTTLSLHTIAEAQRRGEVCAFIDMEHALDPDYASNLGVDLDKLLISQPDNGEQALEITETLVRTGAVGVVVVDSVAALVPRKEIEGDMGDSNMGLQARLMSQAMRKLSGICYKTNTTLIFINQIRMKLGVMFGNPECVAPNTQVTWRKSTPT